MATRRKTVKGGVRQVNAAARGFVDAVARSVAGELREDLPTREEFRELKREIRELRKKVKTMSGAAGARRAGRPRSDRKCERAGCNRPHVAQGLCSRHYQANRRKEQLARDRKAAKKRARKR